MGFFPPQANGVFTARLRCPWVLLYASLGSFSLTGAWQWPMFFFFPFLQVLGDPYRSLGDFQPSNFLFRPVLF